jgi:hypothetical protein
VRARLRRRIRALLRRADRAHRASFDPDLPYAEAAALHNEAVALLEQRGALVDRWVYDCEDGQRRALARGAR